MEFITFEGKFRKDGNTISSGCRFSQEKRRPLFPPPLIGSLNIKNKSQLRKQHLPPHQKKCHGVLTLSLGLLSFAKKGESVVEVGVAENEKQFFWIVEVVSNGIPVCSANH